MINFLRRTINLCSIMVLSIIFSILVALLIYFYSDLYYIKNFNKVLDGFLLFITISIGFFGTCVSILATLISAPIMQIVFGNTSYKYQFIFMVLFAMGNGIIAIILTVIFQMTFGEKEHGFFEFCSRDTISALWVFTSLNYLMSLFLVTLISMAILFKSQNPIPQIETYDPELKED